MPVFVLHQIIMGAVRYGIHMKKHAVERAEDFVFEDERFSYKKVPDGFKILDVNGRIVRYYKVFDAEELE